MQNVSQAYKDSMKQERRNRGYIKATIGIVNSDAQKSLSVDDPRNEFAFFANKDALLISSNIKYYATCEQDFSQVGGNMYFLPRRSDGIIYNNGLVTAQLYGAIYISFGNMFGLDIKGLTIDFGEYYPVDFTIEYDEGSYTYTGNDKSYWMTEDVFNGTSYLKIIPLKMVNGNGRLRIFNLICGIANTFSNKDTISYSLKDYVSPISEILPSQDMSLVVDNQDLYYSADNPDSALAYMEVGQEIEVSFGYDVHGDGNIEWLPPNTCYLKTWSADDIQAKFTATDRFDYLSDVYYKGLYRPEGISLYDLAVDVFADAGLGDKEYFIDPYLRKVMVQNPMPAVSHSEALQIIANAGRCVLYEDRNSRIHIQASFVPDMVASSNGETDFSHVENILNDDMKDAYAMDSMDFSIVNGRIYFLPKTAEYLNTGYISSQVADGDGHFSENPRIIINLEADFITYCVTIRFRSTAPQEFHIMTYYEDMPVADVVIIDPELECVCQQQFDLFNRMELVFTKGYPNGRVTVDHIVISDAADYTITYACELTKTPTGTRQNKIQSINVNRSIYRESTEEVRELVQEEAVLSPANNECTAYIPSASYDLSVSVIDNAEITCEIIESSNYFARIRFDGLKKETSVKYSVMGKEYTVDTNYYIKKHHPHGEVISWTNPLISATEHAKNVEEWLASYYLGDVEYSLPWRGDPRTDANDLFYLELKGREKAMVRCFQNELSFDGAWSGTINARKVVL